MDEIKRFWAKVDKRSEDECWPWLGAIEKTGYGRFKDSSGKAVLAHRKSFLIANGFLSESHVIDHLCFNRKCVNPYHLREVSRDFNATRHNPSCKCAACNPGLYVQDFCARGHDLRLPNARKTRGKWSCCRECFKIRDREFKRKIRGTNPF